MYLLDTNHCSFIFIQKDSAVLNHLSKLPKSTLITINTIVYGELILMAEKSEKKAENRSLVEAFLEKLKVYPLDEETAKNYGQFYAEIFNKFAPKDKAKRRKFKIEEAGVRLNDLWIACTAIQHKLTIVSEDSDFTQMSKVRPLLLECWK